MSILWCPLLLVLILTTLLLELHRIAAEMHIHVEVWAVRPRFGQNQEQLYNVRFFKF